VKIALAQINPTVGDFAGNIAKILSFTRKAAGMQAELVMFPELSICGYPPADLLEKPSFIERSEEAVLQIAQGTADLPLAVLCGSVIAAPVGSGKHIQNAAVLLCKGRKHFTQPKMLLPFYDVFDEQRYFEPAKCQAPSAFHGEQLAITICEDAWNDKIYWEKRYYEHDPVETLMREGGSLILNISASPFYEGKREIRNSMLSALARRHRASVLMVNQIGGNDSLIFDGSSLAIGPDGTIMAQARSFEEDLVIVDTNEMSGQVREQDLDPVAATFKALVLGTRDYVRKCGFSRVLVSLSGGIDSALVVAIAVEAMGRENVLGVGMPSPYSSLGSIEDSRQLAANLGIRFEVIPINGLFAEFNRALEPIFTGLKPDLTEENLQSRTRGTLLMALSNKFNSLVLTAGNKSEMSVGYCTLYGDMVGALAVIGDVLKTRVYDLCRYLNRNQEIIPSAILTKPPSAELRPGQQDTDSLPPYEVLDPILQAYVERYETPEFISRTHGFPLDLVRSVVKLVERSEYKRQQAAPVLKVTSKSFGTGRRFPIAVKVQV
jgi:NAD+ synthase (glutamine-hydrolysing)